MDYIILVSGWLLAMILLTYLIKMIIKRPDGYILINTNDPEKDTYTLELSIPFGELDNRKIVIFKIRKDSPV